MRHSFCILFSLIGVLLLIVISCDSTDGPTNALQQEPGIDEISVTPTNLVFGEELGIRDTTVTFQVSARSTNLPDDNHIVIELTSVDEQSNLLVDTLYADSDTPGSFSGSFTLDFSTTELRNLVLYAYPSGSGSRMGNRAEVSIKVRGTPSGKPVLVEVTHPPSVQVPSSGTRTFFIAANVTHTVNMDFIDRVRLELYNSAGTRIFEGDMSDQNPDYGNVRGDSIYVQGFTIDASANVGTYSVEVHALDIAGTSSDTLRSNLVFHQ